MSSGCRSRGRRSSRRWETAAGCTPRGRTTRSAVRETLYPGFGPDRYESVITALLALRKEKLSQNLDLDKLSDILSEALPLLDEHDLAMVAEGFERLDRRRAELTALEAELTEVCGPCFAPVSAQLCTGRARWPC